MSTVEALQSIEDLDRDELLRESVTMTQADKDCRITLAASWPKPITLSWNNGNSNGRTTVISLAPGKSVVQPLWKAMAWFGPFGLLLEFKNADPKRKEFLREKYAAERGRVLNRYDYPRPISKGRHGQEPTGPHRFPDLTVAIRDDDGSEFPEIRLHQLYKIGEWDETYPIDSFGPRETIDEVKARYEAELKSGSERYERELAEMGKKLAEVAGMVQGMAMMNGGAKPAGKGAVGG